MNKKPITFNLEQAAREFGVSKETLRRGLRDIGKETGKGVRYDLRTLYRAMTGDLKTERARLVRAQADREEVDLLERKKELVPCDVSIQTCERWAQPIREAWLSLPARVAALVNPGDPNHARAILQARVDEDMRLLEVPKAMATKEANA